MRRTRILFLVFLIFFFEHCDETIGGRVGTTLCDNEWVRGNSGKKSYRDSSERIVDYNPLSVKEKKISKTIMFFILIRRNAS